MSQISDELVDHLAEPKNGFRLFRGEGRTPTVGVIPVEGMRLPG